MVAVWYNIQYASVVHLPSSLLPALCTAGLTWCCRLRVSSLSPGRGKGSCGIWPAKNIGFFELFLPSCFLGRIRSNSNDFHGILKGLPTSRHTGLTALATEKSGVSGVHGVFTMDLWLLFHLLLFLCDWIPECRLLSARQALTLCKSRFKLWNLDMHFAFASPKYYLLLIIFLQCIFWINIAVSSFPS